MGCNSILNLNDCGFLIIEYPLYNKKEISFSLEDEEGIPISANSQYEFSISKDANFDEKLITLTNNDGIEVIGNEIFVKIELSDSCEIGKKMFELKDTTIDETIVSGEFIILERLIS